MLLDALPTGDYTLHLSGPLGLADLAGNPLVGNDPSGDYAVSFSVQGPPRGTPGNPTAWLTQEPNDTPQQPQVLGTLLPMELVNGVTVTRDYQQNPSPGVADTGDYPDHRPPELLVCPHPRSTPPDCRRGPSRW